LQARGDASFNEQALLWKRGIAATKSEAYGRRKRTAADEEPIEESS